MKNDIYILQKDLFGAKIGDEVHFVAGALYHLKLNDTESLTLKAQIVENNPDYFVLKDESAHYKEIDLYHCFMNRHKYKDDEFKKYLNNRNWKGNEYETKNGIGLELICNENDWDISAFISLSTLAGKKPLGFIKGEDELYHSDNNVLTYEYLLNSKDFCIFSVKRISDSKVFGIDKYSENKDGFILGIDNDSGISKQIHYNQTARQYSWTPRCMFIKLIDGKIYQEQIKYK